MSADWALGSLVVAIIALAISRELPLTMFTRTIIGTCLQWLRFESAFCDSAVWDNLPDGACFHSHRNCSPDAPGRALFSKLSDTHGTQDFLEYFSALSAYKDKRAVKKPLDLDLMRKYFHTDVKTLFLCCMSTIDQKCTWQFRYNPYSNSYTLLFGKSFLVLKKHAKYFEADIRVPCRDCDIVTRRTKVELESIIISGSPPWYQEMVENDHRVAFSFPQPDGKSMARAGWIIAIGLGDAKALPYFATSFGDFKPLSPISHHRGPGQGSYGKGCQYLLKFICGQIAEAFPDDPYKELVQVTNKAIEGMLKDHTGSASAISRFLNNTPLENAVGNGEYTGGLDVSDIEFAIDIFNSLYLERPQIDRLRGILLPVLAGSIRGLHHVLQHLNTHSFQLRGEFNDLVVENAPVFLGY